MLLLLLISSSEQVRIAAGAALARDDYHADHWQLPRGLAVLCTQLLVPTPPLSQPTFLYLYELSSNTTASHQVICYVRYDYF